MKKFFWITVTMIVLFFALCAFSDDFMYEVNIMAYKAIVHESGLYCSYDVCLGVVMTHEELMEKNLAYMREYGPDAPGRPGRIYHWNSDVNAYIRVIED